LIVCTKGSGLDVLWATSNFGGVVPTNLGEQGTGKAVMAAYILAANLPASGAKSWSIDQNGATRGFLMIAALKGAAQSVPDMDGVVAASGTSAGPTAVTTGVGGIAFQA